MESLVNYLEGMESQFGEVIKELKEVRGQLEQIQDRGIKATAARLLDSAGGKVQEIGGQITHVKTNLVRSAKNAVQEFKEKGVDALRKAVSAMKIPTVLSALKESLHSGMESMERSAAKIGIVGGELNKAAQHTKNAGRALTGRRIKEPAEPGGDKKPSVKAELRQIKSGRSAGQKMQPAREQAR